jgi:hypothetical protein
MFSISFLKRRNPTVTGIKKTRKVAAYIPKTAFPRKNKNKARRIFRPHVAPNPQTNRRNLT